MIDVSELREWKIGERMKSKGAERYSIDGLLLDQGQSLMFSHTGHTKSFVAIDIAFHIATGLPYHGKRVRKGPVYYVAGEGVTEIEHRMMTCEHEHGVKADDLILIDVPLQLPDKNHVGWIIKRMKDRGAVLVVFDTAEKTTIGVDENAPTQVNEFVNAPLERIRHETGAGTLLLHHQASAMKGGPRWRGCSAWGTPNDTIIHIDTHFKVKTNRDTPLVTTLQVQKVRGSEPFAVHFKPIIVPKQGAEEGKTTLVMEPISASEAKRIKGPARSGTDTGTSLSSGTEAMSKPPTYKRTATQRLRETVLNTNEPTATSVVAERAEVNPETARVTLNRLKGEKHDGRRIMGDGKGNWWSEAA
jgi:hypothetical protein